MAGDYPITQIGELASSISDTHKFGKEQLVFLNTSDILHGKFLHRTYSAVKDWPGQAKKSIRKDDILFSEIRPANGRWAYVEEVADDFVVSTKLMVIRAKQDRLFPKFLYQFLTSSEITKWLQHLAESRSGTFPQITFDQVATLELPLPPLAEQKAIAAVLGALDDKIELNRRMNATLEAMARALFQSWFVDFDPVRRNKDQGGRTKDEISALFPDSFQESEAGHIPQGWKIKTLSDLTSLITKGTTPTQDDMNEAPDIDSQFNYIRVNSIDEEGSVLADKLTTIPESIHIGVLKRSILKANDILYTIAGTIGRVAMVEDWLLPANTNQAVAIIRPEPEIPSGFLMLTMRQEAFRKELHNNIVHAVQANLSLGMLSKARLVVPPSSVLPQLFRPIDAILSQISANRAQSRTLAILRDTLLPKLLSGELSVEAVSQT